MATRDVTPRGAEPVPRLRASRRRYGEDGVKVLLGLCAADLDRDDDRHRDLAARAGDRVLPRDQLHRLHHGHALGAALRASLTSASLPLLAGTFSVTIWASLVCIPFGLGAAIYLSEYASPRVRKVAEAGARDPRRDPDRRLRLLRAALPDPAAQGHRARRRRRSTRSRPGSSSGSWCSRPSPRSPRTR